MGSQAHFERGNVILPQITERIWGSIVCNIYQATSHLCFSTLYRGTKGSRMGTDLTYF